MLLHEAVLALAPDCPSQKACGSPLWAATLVIASRVVYPSCFWNLWLLCFAGVSVFLRGQCFAPIASQLPLDQAIPTLPGVKQLRQMLATLPVGIICLAVMFRNCVPQQGPHLTDNNTQIVPTHRELTA